jgi:alpha-N-arabinofuranosidase
VYNATEPQDFNIKFQGIQASQKATLTVLTAPDGWSVNALVDGVSTDVVQKTVTALTLGKEGTYAFTLDNYSIAVLVT